MRLILTTIILTMLTQPVWAQSVWMMTSVYIRPSGGVYLESYMAGMLIFKSLDECNRAVVSNEPFRDSNSSLRGGRFHAETVTGGVKQVTACVEIPLTYLPR